MVNDKRVASAIQEFGIISGYRFGAMVCSRCGKEKGKPGWYHHLTIQHPCVECGGGLKFEQRAWEPESFRTSGEKPDSPTPKTRSKK